MNFEQQAQLRDLRILPRKAGEDSNTADRYTP